ncbi:DNA mismatch repair protein Mlh3 isoform X2 [Mugil cephalus]|uniref:DNA mismatch repair protein Mlh3 isoform X2 n=1 Tax=Mugil cephalus TaxID=48193 RepID=UPI001FB7F162|nr:DNA mismatch repair protein Mlh3 isoform X2 [Mugil cephalus]
MVNMIKCLPREVQGKLRSGVAIPSLQQCIEELLLNSIDAGATCVGVRMDMEALKVQVIDNGAGMSAEDMECVGNRYHTSKCSSVKDLDDLRWYGFRGEALASIVSMATLVEISSRTRSSVKTHVKIFKDGQGLEVFEAETVRPSAGTTVIICNFFHNMPVRRKRVDAVLEGERIRHRVEAISLMHPSVSFTLKNDCTGAMLVQLPKARNTYHRFIQIHSLGRAEKLGEISYTHRQFEVAGYLGKEGHYNNSLQFLYVNERLLLKTRIHKLLNFLLRRLSGSNQKSDSPDGQSVIRSPKHKRSQELCGVYVLNIKCSYSEYDICLEPAKTLIEFKDWDGILVCIEEAVKAFLSRENLVAVFSQDDLNCVSPKVFCTDRAEQEGNSDRGDQASFGTSALDCGIGMKLASESVHRKRTGGGGSANDAYMESGVTECNSEETGHLEKINANEMEKTHREKCVNEECIDEPYSHNEINDEEKQILNKDGEGLENVHTSNELKGLFLKEVEIQLSGAASTSDINSQHSVVQHVWPDLNHTEKVVPRCQSGDRHGQSLGSNRKISLSDPYIHESLQTQDLPQTNKTVFQEEEITANSKEKLKRKISLDACRDGSSQKQFRNVATVLPRKIARVDFCHKLSTYEDSGSLDRFRRLYSKSDKGKLLCHDTRIQKNTRLPQRDDVMSRSVSVCEKTQQEGDDTEAQEKEETQSSIKTLPNLSSVAEIKPDSDQRRGEKSLSAKLCHLKQHKTEDSLHMLRTSQDNISLSHDNDGVQDSNNNEDPCDATLSLEQVPGGSTNPQLAEKEEETTLNDWLHHYDTSVGRTVYVNKETGLSRYEDPGTEETQVPCTSDVTNMAVSVISEMEDVGESSNSLSSLYSKWKNPVFVRPPTVGVDISSAQAEGLAVKIHNILFPYRFSKAMIHSMKVIHQVDKKFLACLINTRDEEPETEANLLVLVDQHAAHERVRLENLVADSYEDDPDTVGEKRLCSSAILPPLEISVTEEELRLLRSCQPHLRSLGLEVTFSQAAEPQVFVGKVPLCFMERESNELRRGRPSVIKPIVQEYLQEQIELLRSAGRVRGTLPLTVLKVLASLACHGAIKFNDTLSRDECCSLVASLSSCQLPFQCAHGRPSIAPLVDILHLDKDQSVADFQKPNLLKLRRMYKAWELYGNG